MKERPILFSAPMVRALLKDRKTQTRRIVKLNAAGRTQYGGRNWHLDDPNAVLACPYGQPGDRLWVRETFDPIYPQDTAYNNGEPIEYDYAATYEHGHRLGDHIGIKKVWKPSIFMPRRASRIMIEITEVKVERLQEITPTDAIAEGVEGKGKNKDVVPDDGWRMGYRNVWESINGHGSWDSNPFVWVVSFQKI